MPFLLLALVAMAQLIRPRMPRLGTSAMVLGYAGGLGFLGIHAASIVDHAAVDQPDRAAMVALLESAQGSALALLILAPFLLGMAGSVLLTSIGYLRTRVVPIWIPVVLLVFLVLDFGQFPTGPVDPHWLFVAAAVGLAVDSRQADRPAVVDRPYPRTRQPPDQRPSGRLASPARWTSRCSRSAQHRGAGPPPRWPGSPPWPRSAGSSPG